MCSEVEELKCLPPRPFFSHLPPLQSRMADAGCFDDAAAGRAPSAAPRQRSDLNLGSLLLSFLELYGRVQAATLPLSPHPRPLIIPPHPFPPPCEGHNLNYFTTGISVRGTGGGCYFAKRKRGWFDANRPWLLSIESPVDPVRNQTLPLRCQWLRSAGPMLVQVLLLVLPLA